MRPIPAASHGGGLKIRSTTLPRQVTVLWRILAVSVDTY